MNNMQSTPPQPTTGNSSKAPWLIGLVVIALIIAGIFIFAGGGDEELTVENEAVDTELSDGADDNSFLNDFPPANAPNNNAEEASDSNSAGTSELAEGEAKTFEITGEPFSFSQEELRVNEGDTVRIVFSSTQGSHDWVIDEFNAATEVVNPGQTTEVEFVADQAGSFEYYCSVNNHRQQGMVGTLIVE